VHALLQTIHMSNEDPVQPHDEAGVSGASNTSSQDPKPSVLRSISELLRPLAISRFRIIDLADPEQTIGGIKKDIEFRGFNLWILVFSIIICSIGLNVDSTAVVIGAMLISPLMGPIMGLGLGLGTNDAATFKNALGNLGIAVGIAILTSALYFFTSPLNEASSELLSRTQPTLLDVVVALFGGLAGILAGSRKEKSNVIPGVAIATALMPPLCTAGYGLANGEWNFLLGGFYLFLINTALIALSTWVVVRYLRFPVLHYVEPAVERRYKRLSALLFLALLGPSAWIFFGIVVESRENAELYAFVDTNMKLAGTSVTARIDRAIDPPELQVEILGRPVSDEQEEEWRKQLALSHPNIALSVYRTSIDEADIEDLQNQVQLMMSSYSDLSAKEQQINQLRAQLTIIEGEYRRLQNAQLPNSLGEELLANHPEASAVQWGRIHSVEQASQVNPEGWSQLNVNWNTTLTAEETATIESQLTRWLTARIQGTAPVQVAVIPTPSDTVQ
jgi:uncharacterized hydrophobic protein (TIGR00271 family)